ncbi:MAG TPA: hypothetical protein PKO06_12835, partial [Candidatus Ozemobacteraceae bacterium]|nr:hypothetical protein [Candidatus Ozemobacteraceae bacterium]
MKAEIPLSRGLYTDVVDIRRRVFAEIARIFWTADYRDIALIKDELVKIPYRVINREDPTYRCCVSRERAIVRERSRLAIGLPPWKGELSGPMYQGL